MPKRSQDSESAYQVSSMDESIVDFENPPVSEVVCGVGFTKPDNFTSPYMGLFWSTVRDEFPVAEVKPPLPPPGSEFNFILSDTPPPPRYFLRTREGDELLQLQENRFLYNWLQTQRNPKYPRYKNVIKRFHKLRKQFEMFLQDHDLQQMAVRELRLTYVNHIMEGEGWNNLADVGKIFPNFQLKQRGRRYLRGPTGWNFKTWFPVKDRNSRLQVTIRNGIKKIAEDPEQRLYVLDLTVIGDVVDPSQGELQRWFDMAREAIDLSFLDLTSSKIQNEIWKVQEHA